MDRADVPGRELALIRIFSSSCLGVGWAAIGLFLYASSCATWPAYCIPDGTFPGYPILGGVAVVAGTVIQWVVSAGMGDFLFRCFAGFGAGVGLFGVALTVGALIGG